MEGRRPFGSYVACARNLRAARLTGAVGWVLGGRGSGNGNFGSDECVVIGQHGAGRVRPSGALATAARNVSAVVVALGALGVPAVPARAIPRQRAQPSMGQLQHAAARTGVEGGGVPAGALAGPAWTRSEWSLEHLPRPKLPLGGLSADACTSPAFCVAVGSYRKPGTQVTLAEAWNGTAWTTQTTPNPAGATASQLSGVSCSSATACTAVGYYSDRSGTHTLAEACNGTAWTVPT